jgi:hypothetical protein
MEDLVMNLGSQIGYACVLAIPVACVAWTVTQEEILREFREWLKAFQQRHSKSLWRQKLAYMPTCSYCFSHYVAALFVGLLGFKMLVDDWRGYLVSGLTVVLMANVYLSLYCMLRAALRALRAKADEAEARGKAEKDRLNSRDWAKRDMSTVAMRDPLWPAWPRSGTANLRRNATQSSLKSSSNSHR